jgi:hypothetical protein
MAGKSAKIKNMPSDKLELNQQKIVFMFTEFLLCERCGGCLVQANPKGLKVTAQAVLPDTVAADI